MKFTLQPTKRKISHSATNITGYGSVIPALYWVEHVTRIETTDTGFWYVNLSGTDRLEDPDADDGIGEKSA
jgi:hypothetical protein